jgi:hypothetical protein
MQRCDVRYRIPPAQWKMHVIDMKMNDVEIGRARENMFEHGEVVGHLILAMLIQAQRPPAGRHQARIGFRITTRKQRHFVSLSHQFLREIRHHAFCSPVIFRRYALIKRRHLCNSHTQILNPPLPSPL